MRTGCQYHRAPLPYISPGKVGVNGTNGADGMKPCAGDNPAKRAEDPPKPYAKPCCYTVAFSVGITVGVVAGIVIGRGSGYY